MNDTLYHVLRTRTLSQILEEPNDPDAEGKTYYEYFEWFYQNCGLPDRLLSEDDYSDYGLETIYGLLLSRYANAHIASSDESRFKLEMMSIIFQHGKEWQRLMSLQDKLAALTDEELMAGAKITNNHANHPDVQPGVDAIDSLPFIDEQNKTIYQKDKTEAFSRTMMFMNLNTTENFLDRFQPLFVQLSYDADPLLYEEEDTWPIT